MSCHIRVVRRSQRRPTVSSSDEIRQWMGAHSLHLDAARQLSGLPSQSFQRTNELLVIAPASHGTVVNLLTHLPGAGGGHDALIRMELQAPWIPFEIDK